MSPTTPFKYVSEITGSGKTNNLLNKIAKSTQNYILAFPTIDLCDEISNYLGQRKVIDNVVVIHCDNFENPLHKFFNSVCQDKNTRIIITTHATISRCMSVKITPEMKDWNLVIDEDMQFFNVHDFSLTDRTTPIIDSIVDVDEYDDTFYEVVIKDMTLAQKVLDGTSNDSLMDHTKVLELINYLLSDQYTTLIPKRIYEKYLEHTRDDDGNGLGKPKFKKFYCLSLVNHNFLNGFREITVLSSFYEKTINYLMLQWLGVSMERIKLGTSKPHHENSELVTINYYTRINWTRTFKKKEINHPLGKVTVEDLILERVLRELRNKEFIYSSNKDLRRKETFGSGKLVTSIRGVNSYSNYTNMLFMQSLNAGSTEVALLRFFGISRSQIDFSRTVLGAYQFISRGAIRKTNNNKEISIHVMDKRTCDFLLGVFPNATTVYHEMDITFVKEEMKDEEGKREPISAKDRTFVSRTKKKIREGKPIREATMNKYNKILKEYYE